MFEIGNYPLPLKKSYEIAYAFWMVAANIPERQFSDKLLAQALELIGNSSSGNYGKIIEDIAGIEFLLKFGGDTNILDINNVDLLLLEIGNLKSAIADLPISDSGKSNFIDLSHIFPEEFIIANDFPETEIEIENADIPEDGNDLEIADKAIGNHNGNAKSEIRQAAILKTIGEIGNCRLSDIQAVLPSVSDRTIRYDLESLVERNLIERVGTGGRSVYYRIR